MKKLLPFLLALVCACATEPVLESPHILSISPATQVSSVSQVVTVTLDQDPRFLVDYGKKTVQMLEQPVLEIGPQTVPLDTYLWHGQFQGTVAPGLNVGRYAIRVTLGDGREASLDDAYEVTANLEKPRLSYWIDTIGQQIQNQPFTITIHVSGTNADQYAGSVLMSTYRGNQKSPIGRSGPFSGGVRQEQISIDTPGDNYLIVVEDDQGKKATSNAFQVVSN